MKISTTRPFNSFSSNPNVGRVLRKTVMLVATGVSLLILTATASAQNVNVTATAGTAAASYTTLKGAFDAVNAGTHQGAITMNIALSTNEGATPAVLNSSGAGAAVYTSVLIRPSADGVTVAGATPIGRGVIELNGADNVTIDGDNPNTGGTNRNLTIQSTATSTTAFTSLIRIALATSVVTSADNNTIKNLNLIGNATGRNIAGAISTTGSENTVYGVLATAGASTVSATTAPSAIASVATTIGSPATAANLMIDNNTVATCARGIAVQGSATTVFPGLTISNNLIGNATASAVDQVYSVGITAQGSGDGAISRNTVYLESFLSSSTSAANRAIDVGSISASGTFTIERNQVIRVKNNAPDFWLAHGINLGGGNNHVVRNNFVQNITLDTTSGGFYSTTFNAAGIRIAAGTDHQIYHNSVNMAAAIPGATNTISAAFMITATTITGLDVRNNIFVNSNTGGSAASAHVSLYLPSGGTSAMNLTLNNNDYFNGAAPTATQGVGQVGTTAGTGFFTQANFDPSTTAGATNFRSYTSTLSASGTNDNATKKVDPQFLSATDLHIALASPMVDMGASVGVGSDIDGQTRVPPPDIGADEPGGIAPVANDIAATAIINPPPGSTRSTTTVITPQASFTNTGTATQTNVPVRFKILDPSTAVVYNMTTTISSINSGQTLTASFPNVTLTPAGTYTTQAFAELPGDQNTANDMVSGTVIISSPVTGTYTVGSGGNYPSLTNTGGFFEAVNAAGASGNIVLNVISDLPGELGTHALNAIAGGFTVTIKPSGAARTISGTSTSTGLIKLNGVDNVTIDGSLSGGTDRSLTITNGNTGATVIWIASASASDGATGNTVKNCILSGNTGTTIIAGVLAGSGTTFGGDAETANSNNTIQNNQIFRVQNAAFLRGNGTSLDQNWLVTGNNWGSAVAADKLLFRGMLIGNAQNLSVTNNTINGISSTTTTSSTMTGIQIALVVNGGTITGNKISDVKHNNTAGWGSNGIYFTASSAASNLTVANNFISDVASQGFNGQADTDNGYGIVAITGGGYKIYHNSVLLNTNQGAGAATGQTAAVLVTAGVTTVGAIDMRDNILASTQTLGTRYGVICNAPATVFSNINYNDYFAQNVGFIGGSARATLANWQTGTGQDANSLSVNPLFTTATAPADLHLLPASTLLGVGTSPALVANDVDNDPRPSTPDIGADELVQSSGGTLAGGTYYNVSTGAGDSLGGNVTVTNVLYLGGILNTGANTLTIDCNAAVMGASPSNYITGNLKKNYCGTGVKGFEVGTANGYSPVSVNVTSGTFPANFTVKAVQGPQPNVTAGSSLQRYWTLTEGGDVTANLQFNYLDPTDIMGTEANYHLIRVTGGVPAAFPNGSCPTPAVNTACVDTTGNTATINGVSNFSDWTLGAVTGPTAAPATISGQVTTMSGAPLPGVTMYLSGARSARTITDNNGNYRFFNVDTDNFYSVTPLIVNYHFSPASRSFSLLANKTDATFTGSLDAVISGNVIDSPEFFVRQHYLDFLGREPDDAGLSFWSDQMRGCGNDFNCIERRTINVSAAYFLSIEFQETGGLVDRLYRASYGRAPLYAEFMPDTATVARNLIVNQAGWEGVLAANKQEFLDAWVQRAEFRAAYDNLGNDGYVDALISHTGVDFTSSERAALRGGLTDGTLTRAGVLQRIAQNERFAKAKFNEAFVRMQYFGYLRRDPDDNGFHFWLNKLNEFDGNFERAEMVKAFLVSGEYRDRFRQ